MIRSSRNAPPLGRRRRVAGVAGIAALTVIGASAASGALSPVQAETSTSALPPAAAAEVVVKPSYERELSSQLDATNSYATVKHLVETIGPRYNGTPQERQGASYLAEKLKPYRFEVQVRSGDRCPRAARPTSPPLSERSPGTPSGSSPRLPGRS